MEDARAFSLLQAAFEATGAGILAVDSNGDVSAYNQRFLDMWQMPVEMMGASGNGGPRIAHIAAQTVDPERYSAHAVALGSDREAEVSEVFELKDGRFIEGTSQPQRLDGEAIGRVWSFRDVTEPHRLQQQLHELSIRDSLTGLYNRRCAEEKLTHEMQRSSRSGHPLSIALLDIDHFKNINDLHGHHVGDVVLRALAQDFMRRLRATDVACRWGGEEFLLILPDTTRKGARLLLDELRRYAARERRDLPPLTFSAGTMQYDGETTLEKFVAIADARLYQAKQAGRDRVI